MNVLTNVLTTMMIMHKAAVDRKELFRIIFGSLGSGMAFGWTGWTVNRQAPLPFQFHVLPSFSV